MIERLPRLLYEYEFKEPPFALIDTTEGQAALRELYCGDVDVALAQGIPIVMNAATFRSSRNFLPAQGFTEAADIRLINVECIQFIKTLRELYRDSDVPVFIGAPVGSLGDAYSVDPTLTVEAASTPNPRFAQMLQPFQD